MDGHKILISAFYANEFKCFFLGTDFITFPRIYIFHFSSSVVYICQLIQTYAKNLMKTLLFSTKHTIKNLKEEIVHCEHGYNNKEYKRKRDRMREILSLIHI